MSERRFEDFTVGDEFELGPHTVTEAEILEFARQYDPQPFHLDPEAARETMFGGLIASGWHTTAICNALCAEALFEDAAFVGGWGVDELRWPTPVRPGDTLDGRVTVVETRPSDSSPERGYVDLEIVLHNDGGETVLSMVSHQILLRE